MMNDMSKQWPTRRRMIRQAWLTAVCVTGLISCGGGGGVDTGGTGLTAGYSSGPITGFGSIVVNGVHFDESAATVLDDEGAVLDTSALKLGMTVQIDSGVIDPVALTATAGTVRIFSDLLGPVQSRDLAAGTLTVLGQTVQITQSTLGMSDAAPGQLVEVYAIPDPVTGTYVARLIQAVASTSSYKLRGVVSALDTTHKTFHVGSATLAYTSATMPSGLADGATLQFKLRTVPDALNYWVVSSASPGHRVPPNGTMVEIEAVVSSYTSLSRLVVDGVVVDAASAQITPAGATLAAGLRVEVEGTMTSGVLMASKLEVKGDSTSAGGDDQGQGQEFQIQGVPSGLDTVAKTFLIRNQKISYAGTVRYEGGTEADLAAAVTGRLKLEVTGIRAPGGTVVQAEEISFPGKSG